MVVLFPRQTSHKTSLEVKKRVLRSVPHMGGKRLKRMVRLHARKGNRNSFIADFESRLDRFLYRTNAVNSTFAARMLIGHKHVMVNGKMVNSTHYILKPGDIVEPNKAPQTLAVWKRMMARRLANNTFVIASRNGEDDRDGGRRPQRNYAPSGGPPQKGVSADFDALMRDGAILRDSYRRWSMPSDSSSSSSTLTASSPATGGASAGGTSVGGTQLNAIVPALLSSLVGDETTLAATVRARRPELSVVAPLQSPGSDAPNAILQWQPANEPNAKQLVSLDRVALRRLMLGLLALRPAGSQP